MPVRHPPDPPHPGAPYKRWSDAVEARQVVTVRCHHCRRVANYLPEDLIKVAGNDEFLHVVPWPCSRCGTKEYMSVTAAVPLPERAATMRIRRPVRPVTRWIWETVPLAKR